jgi:hypothetical protein
MQEEFNKIEHSQDSAGQQFSNPYGGHSEQNSTNGNQFLGNNNSYSPNKAHVISLLSQTKNNDHLLKSREEITNHIFNHSKKKQKISRTKNFLLSFAGIAVLIFAGYFALKSLGYKIVSQKELANAQNQAEAPKTPAPQTECVPQIINTPTDCPQAAQTTPVISSSKSTSKKSAGSTTSSQPSQAASAPATEDQEVPIPPPAPPSE